MVNGMDFLFQRSKYAVKGTLYLQISLAREDVTLSTTKLQERQHPFQLKIKEVPTNQDSPNYSNPIPEFPIITHPSIFLVARLTKERELVFQRIFSRPNIPVKSSQLIISHSRKPSS